MIVFWAFFLSVIIILEPHADHTELSDFYTMS